MSSSVGRLESGAVSSGTIAGAPKTCSVGSLMASRLRRPPMKRRVYSPWGQGVSLTAIHMTYKKAGMTQRTLYQRGRALACES